MKPRKVRDKIEGKKKSVSSANQVTLQGSVDPATSVNGGNRNGLHGHSFDDFRARFAHGSCVYERHGREDGHDLADWIEAVNGDS